MIRLILACSFVFSYSAMASRFQYRNTDIGGFVTKIRVGFHKKSSYDKATLVYLPGYSDRMENHRALFRQLQNSDIRVVSFDYPEHGGSTGQIKYWTVKELAGIANQVMSYTRVDSRKPVILAGWSTGGTVITRILQDWRHELSQQYKIGGAVLIAPGIPVRSEINGGYTLRESTITRGRMVYPPSPSSVYNFFGNDLLNSSRTAYEQNIRRKEPIVVVVGGNRADRYIQTGSVKKWVRRNRQAGRKITGFQCRGAYHGLEFEPSGVGQEVRQIVTEMADAMSFSGRRQRFENTVRVASDLDATNQTCRRF